VEKRQSTAGKPPHLEVVCELFLSDDTRLTAGAAKKIENAIRKTVTEVLPGHRLRAIFIHEGL
jgi:hypothetical protein